MAVLRISFVILQIIISTRLVTAGISTDAIENFCRRVSHSSTLKNQKLYINGGLATFADIGPDGTANSSTATLGANEVLLTIDFSYTFNAKSAPISQDPKMMAAGIPGYKTPPNFKFSALFAGSNDSSKLWAYGGTNSGFNVSFGNYYLAPTSQYGLWNWDAPSNTWSAVDTSAQDLTAPAWGASAEIPQLGLGFYLGGQIDNGTANTTSGLDRPVPVSGMIVIDTQVGTVWNMSNIPSSFKSDRQGAQMIFLTEFGSSGVLLVIGGIARGTFISMSEITIFDVQSLRSAQPQTHTDQINSWWSVNATGDMPQPRTDFCLVSVAAQDRSSVNVYLYGGRMNDTVYDDVYVLSLPSFTWTNVFKGTSPRWGMSCHFYPPRHMIQVGGGGRLGDNLTADCDWEPQGLGFLDLTQVVNSTGWSQTFDANASPYEVPVDVMKVVGGDGFGNATRTTPIGGWPAPALETLFKPNLTVPSTSTAGASISSADKLSAGALVGISIASVFFVLLVIANVYFFGLRRRRMQQEQTKAETVFIGEMGHDQYQRKELDEDASQRHEMGDGQGKPEKDSNIICEVAEASDTTVHSNSRELEL